MPAAPPPRRESGVGGGGQCFDTKLGFRISGRKLPVVDAGPKGAGTAAAAGQAQASQPGQQANGPVPGALLADYMSKIFTGMGKSGVELQLSDRPL